MKPIIEKKGKKILFYNELAKAYMNKEKDRYQLADEYGITPHLLYGCFKKREIEIWDMGSPKTKQNDEICRLYQERKFNRKELSNKYKIPVKRITQSLASREIKLWDRDRVKTKKTIIKPSKYFNWKEEIRASEYAKLFYEYNK